MTQKIVIYVYGKYKEDDGQKNGCVLNSSASSNRGFRQDRLREISSSNRFDFYT